MLSVLTALFAGSLVIAAVLAGKIILGSLTAYMVSQLHDVWSFDRWKQATSGKHLWLIRRRAPVPDVVWPIRS